MIRISPAELDLRRWIRTGDAIVVGQGSAEPQTLTEALVRQRGELGGVEVFLGILFTDTFGLSGCDGLKLRSMGGFGTHRRLVNAGLVEVLPCHSSQLLGLIRRGEIGCDVAFVQVSPPDGQGRYSLGLAADYTRAAADKARVVIAEMNERVPQTNGEGALSEADIDVLVQTNRPLIQLPGPTAGELERRIAAHVDGYIPDRATLQVGLGSIPDAILARLVNRRDLGLHSGMVGDAIVDLVEAGALTNACKGIDEGISVTGLLLGTDPRLYRWAHRNPALRLSSLAHTHDGSVLAQLPRFVSINSALEVDLSGQVNAESIGADFLGAVGGQVDFVRAGSRSDGGASIIALASTAQGGRRSRIVAALSGPVTTPRSDVDVIATEHGAVRLRGLGLRQRANALIELAAPEHREVLWRQARLLGVG